jgi:hypothetical protein
MVTPHRICGLGIIFPHRCIHNFNKEFHAFVLLHPLFIMWRRSRAPCSCPSCATEELRDQIWDLRVVVRNSGERMDSRLRELQMENQELRRHNANLQNQLQSQERRHNQELVIVLRGVNRNTRHIILLSQQLGNPLGRPQHPANSIESIDSRLPSTFHSEAANEQNQAPLDPMPAPARHNQKMEFHLQQQFKQISRKMQKHLTISNQVSIDG